jgi:hypothetical protein
MTKIRFWKWQHTDELGLPSVTRYPMPYVDREMAGHLQKNVLPVETRNPKEVADRTDAGHAP